MPVGPSLYLFNRYKSQIYNKKLPGRCVTSSASGSPSTSRDGSMLLHAAIIAMLVATAAAWSPSGPLLDRRAVFSGAATAALLAPFPAAARSKEKAAEKALQKATAAEARQAMKEYKTAPRPELIGNSKDGYSFKEGTIKAGSSGELAGYFTEKGATIQANYKADRARATGATSEEAKRVASATYDRARADSKKTKELTEDELKIKAYAEKNKGMRDEMVCALPPPLSCHV